MKMGVSGEISVVKLSVILTNYNDANVIGRAIEAIVTQSRQPDEFIIQDDGSTDNSVDIITPYVEKYPFIRFVKNEKNLGAMQAMQKVASYATGDYLYGAAADDYVLPGFFEKAMSFFDKYPQAGLCCGDMYSFHADKNETVPYELLWSDTPVYLTPDMLADVMAGRNFPNGIIRRDAFEKAGGFISELKWHSDWFYNHVVAFRHGLIYIPEKFTVDTVHKKGAYCFEGIQNYEKQAAVLYEAIRLLKTPEYIDVFPYFARSAAFCQFSLTAVQLMMKNEELWDVPTNLLLQHSLFVWSNELVSHRRNLEKKSAELKLGSILKKIEALILDGNIEHVVPLLDSIQKSFGTIDAVMKLREKVKMVKKVIDAHH